MKKMDYLFGIIVIISAVVIWGLAFFSHKSGAYIEVLCEDEILGTYSLSENGEYAIYVSDEAYNILSIYEGKAVIREANCPNQLCTRQRSISKVGETIICLPHKLVFRVVGKTAQDNTLDAIVNAAK